MKINLKEFVENYYREYQEFCKEPLIRKINKQIFQITCMGLKTLNVKPIGINYIWDEYGEVLDINFTVYNKKNKILCRCDGPIKRSGNNIYMGVFLNSTSFGDKILELLEKNRHEIFKLLLKYRFINEKKYCIPLNLEGSCEDYVSMIRAKNYLSFIVYKEDRQKTSYIESMDTMAGFLKMGSEFGIFLNTGEYFIKENNIDDFSISVGKDINKIIEDYISNIYVEDTSLPCELKQKINKSKVLKRRKKDERF